MHQIKPIPIADFDPNIHTLPIADTAIRTGDRIMLYTLNELGGSEGTKTYSTQATPAPTIDGVAYLGWAGIAEHNAEEGKPVRVITNLEENPHILIVTEV